ncbi:GntR family transcriptional regulator [Hathewaya limosa]|uniref:DNA-binding GntR family transcriptional regulator n=1 Tax=Hathewaya limosa TaxID=1536 RepID=A0ABU0JVP1_HATLI|nr:GntR family transcriptional regulator [Hathewaya limosa]MDQ0480203.1 DNA-binding GntR family transcriptional regulator [Hathewaya limosa]
MGKKLATDEIYNILKNRIIQLEYTPGVVLNEVDIANEFDISRTPIREIFQKLNSDRLLNIIPRFGAQVTYIDFKYMKSVFEVTREVEPFATKLCVERIDEKKIGELEEIMNKLNQYNIKEDYQKAILEDEKFHDIVLNSSGNQCLEELLLNLHIHTERLWHYSEQYIDSMELFTETLGKILCAIKERSKEKAEKYAREHIDAFVEKIKKEML